MRTAGSSHRFWFAVRVIKEAAPKVAVAKLWGFVAGATRWGMPWRKVSDSVSVTQKHIPKLRDGPYGRSAQPREGCETRAKDTVGARQAKACATFPGNLYSDHSIFMPSQMPTS